MKKLLILLVAVFTMTAAYPQGLIDRMVQASIPSLYIVDVTNCEVFVSLDGKLVYHAKKSGENVNLSLRGYYNRPVRMKIEIVHKGFLSDTVETFSYDLQAQPNEQWQLTIGDNAKSTELMKLDRRL